MIPFFAFPPEVRRVIYTTNAIESVNARLRKIIKTRGHFPSDDAASKLIWLALRNITADWGRAAKDWKEAMNQFAILYEDRFTQVRRVRCRTDLPTASVVRRKRRPPPWTSLIPASHTEIQTSPQDRVVGPRALVPQVAARNRATAVVEIEQVAQRAVGAAHEVTVLTVAFARPVFRLWPILASWK